MDIVDFDETVYEKIKADYLKFAEQLNVSNIKFVSREGLGVFVCISPWNFPLAIFLGQVTALIPYGWIFKFGVNFF